MALDKKLLIKIGAGAAAAILLVCGAFGVQKCESDNNKKDAKIASLNNSINALNDSIASLNEDNAFLSEALKDCEESKKPATKKKKKKTVKAQPAKPQTVKPEQKPMRRPRQIISNDDANQSVIINGNTSGQTTTVNTPCYTHTDTTPANTAVAQTKTNSNSNINGDAKVVLEENSTNNGNIVINNGVINNYNNNQQPEKPKKFTATITATSVVTKKHIHTYRCR